MSDITAIFQLIKEHSDIVIMIVGIFLIVVGIVLFITGRYSNNDSHVEGFGIKMDVKNPSLILIVFGVFLLTLPIMNVKDQKSSSEKQPEVENIIQPTQQKKIIPKVEVEQKQNLQATALSPIVGSYSLFAYVEDGIPYYNLTGELSIEVPKNEKYGFYAEFFILNEWNNTTSVSYTGYFVKRSNRWYLKINASSDPEWHDLGEVATELLYDESANSLGLKYYYDANVASVWSKKF